jgi:hypothetical protein
MFFKLQLMNLEIEKLQHTSDVIELYNQIINIVYKGYEPEHIKRHAMQGVISMLYIARENCTDTLSRRLEGLHNTAWEIYNNNEL